MGWDSLGRLQRPGGCWEGRKRALELEVGVMGTEATWETGELAKGSAGVWCKLILTLSSSFHPKSEIRFLDEFSLLLAVSGRNV